MNSSGSAMVDLKAELSRKEHELSANMKTAGTSGKGNKTFAKIQEKCGKKKKHKKEIKSSEVDIQNKEIDSETLQLLEKARQKLEAKSKIYDKMQKGEMEDVEDIYGETKFLVDFQQKYYSRDEPVDKEENEVTNESQASLLFEANELHREKMRAKWEKEQEELLDGPIHYENVKFDEIRELGTGYFAFSKDEEERKKQQEELQNMRDHTKTVQNKKELLHNKRKAALQERLNKVKARKLGHTVLESTKIYSEIKIADDKININKTSGEDTSDDTTALSSTDENELQQCRKESRKEREWDKGKRIDGMVKLPFVKETEHKQPFVRQKEQNPYEKNIQERRNERDDEFAPPHFY